MKLIYSKNNQYVLRILRGEEAVEQILEFCAKEGIDSGWVQGLGAADRTEISYYDLEKKEYVKKVVEEECELLSLTGNISHADGKLMLHAHVVLGTNTYGTIGGHLSSMRISGTGEIMITKLDGYLERELDEDTGLKLLKE
jgi:predicted DNA-binding protein with PD1-like motif